RLQARFGRSWRRKAPVESLMPLRLARFGVPLAQTGPAGLAAAGIEPALLPPAPEVQSDEQIDAEVGERAYMSPGQDELMKRSLSRGPSGLPGNKGGCAPRGAEESLSVPGPRSRRAQREPSHGEHGPEADTAADQAHETAHRGAGQQRADRQSAASPWFRAGQTKSSVRELDDEQYYAAFCAYVAELGDYPNAHQFGRFLMDVFGVVGRSGGPLDEQAIGSCVAVLRQRYQPDLDVESANVEPTQQATPDVGEALEETAAVPGSRVPPEVKKQGPVPPGPPAEQREPSLEHGPTPRASAPHEAVQPTAVDRYYLGYESFLHTHGRDPSREELAAHLAGLGITNPQGRPVKANAVGRYQLEFRAYAVWAAMCETTGTEPDLVALLEEVNERGIKGLHNKPLTAQWMAERIEDFRRRRRAIAPDVVDWSSVIS
ncbi:hypothetical protein AB0I94_41885, partial [Streptomyces sp. NPDC050147]